jgi:hypothetical protein
MRLFAGITPSIADAKAFFWVAVTSTKIRSREMSGCRRPIVSLSSVVPSSIEKSGLGRFSRLAGQNRVPRPPAIMSAEALPDAFGNPDCATGYSLSRSPFPEGKGLGVSSVTIGDRSLLTSHPILSAWLRKSIESRRGSSDRSPRTWSPARAGCWMLAPNPIRWRT